MHATAKSYLFIFNLNQDFFIPILFQTGIFDESISSFFRNVDTRYDRLRDIPVGNSKGKIKSLKARVSCIKKTYHLPILH